MGFCSPHDLSTLERDQRVRNILKLATRFNMHFPKYRFVRKLNASSKGAITVANRAHVTFRFCDVFTLCCHFLWSAHFCDKGTHFAIA